jgi:transposase
MSRKAKYSLIEKLKAIEEYISDEKGATQIIHEMSIDQSTFYEWVRKYRHNGLESLKASSTNKYYSDSVKITAVKDYLDGKGSLRNICGIYRISSTYVLRNWIKKYNSHKTFKSHNKQGDRIMTNGRKTTYEERTEIVAFCISNNDDYQATADKFKVSYQQVYTWVRKYEANGYEALMDRRGKRKEAAELTESQKLSAQLKLIESENTRLKMEIDFLKKLKEVERRR